MKTSVFLIFPLLICSFAWALDVHKTGDKVMLTDSCSNGNNIISSLSKWTQNIKAGKGCDGVLSPQKNGDQCTYDITSCVPEHVVKYQDATAENDGPNCWNLSLVMSGILPSLRYAAPEEMSFYMRPPLCRQLKNGEARQPGDVGAIREVSIGGVQESHGFIYISDKIAYSKNGFSSQSPYKLQSLENVMKTYDVPDKKACRQNQINLSSDCGIAVSYFRCDSMNSYLGKHPEISKQVHDAFAALDAADACVSKQAFKGGALGAEAKKNIADVGTALQKFAEQAKDSPDFKKLKQDQKDFILSSIMLRLYSIASQLGMSNEWSASDQAGSFMQMFADSAEELVTKKGK